MAGHPVRYVLVCTLSGFPTDFASSSSLANIQVYFNQTLEFGIWYSASSLLNLVGFFDADFAGCEIDRKKHFWYMSLSWIFSRLLVFLQTIFYCSIYHKG
jgi:hypothetical protein